MDCSKNIYNTTKRQFNYYSLTVDSDRIVCLSSHDICAMKACYISYSNSDSLPIELNIKNLKYMWDNNYVVPHKVIVLEFKMVPWKNY